MLALERYVNILREHCFRIFDLLLFRFGKESIGTSAGKVLVLRLDAIGDFVLWINAVTHYRELYPREQYHLTLLGNNLWTSLAKDLGIFDQVWSLDRRKFSKNIWYRIAMLKKVRREGFATAIHPSYSRDLMFGDTIIRASGATERIGSMGDCSNITSTKKRKSDQWYTTLLPTSPEAITELERNAEFLRGLGLSNFKCSIPELPVVVPGPIPFDRYYVLFPGAGASMRQWPIANFARLAEKIHNVTGWTGIVCGGAGEAKLGEDLRGASTAPLENWAGKTSLQELIATIAQAKLLLGNETSAVHIAAAVSTPCVCLLGGGHYGRFLPYRLEQPTTRPLPIVCAFRMDCYGCNWDCPYCSTAEVAPCIARINVDEVWKTVHDLLIANGAADKYK